MTYQGYMALANDSGETLELVNAARVKTYTDNLAPTLGLRGCEDCEGLDEALGQTYTTPAGDNAPWYDPTDPATADFYGVYPLGFEGIDDSTRSIETAELAGDGSVVVGSRFTGKDIRVTGVAFAKDEAALYAGVSWLDSALNGTEEGRCFGDRLDLYSSCPPVQELPEDFATPYTLVNPPSAAELAAWTTTSGTITSQADGVKFDWSTGDPQKIACREITGLIPGEQYQLRLRLENFGNYYVRIADSCAESRTNRALNPRLLGWAFTGAGLTDVESDETTGGPLGLGWRKSITTNTNTGSPYALDGPLAERIPVTPGELLQVSAYMIGSSSSGRMVARFYDAGAVLISTVDLATGVTMDNTWRRAQGLVVVPANAETVRIGLRWSTSAGSIGPNTVFGGANMLVESATYETLRINLNNDPRAQTDGTNWTFLNGTGGATTAAFVVGAVDGPVLYDSIQATTYRRHTVTAAATGGTAGPSARDTSTLNFPTLIPTGTEWRTGAWFRSNRTVTGTARYRLSTSAGVALQDMTEAATLVANTWTYLSGGRATISDLTTVGQAIARFEVTGAATQVGDIYEMTGSLLSIDTTDEEYFDNQRPPDGDIAYMVQELGDGSDGAKEVQAEPVGSYFDGYTDGFRWTAEPDASASESDVQVDYETQFGRGSAGEPPTEPTVLDFIPREESVFLSIQPTQKSLAVPTEDLLVKSALVRRTERPGVVSFGTGYNVVPPSDGWTHLAPATAEVIWLYGESVEFQTVRTDMQAPFGSALTYTTAHGVERTLFGLRPGSRYRLMIEFSTYWTETDVSPAQQVVPIIEISNSTGQVTTFTDDNPGSFQYFRVIEFTATTTSSTLFMHPTANLVLGSFGFVTWAMDEYLVEEILETDATEPQPGRLQERTMYEVKASQGPILTNVRRSPCGVMGQITYSLRAGNPFKYRSAIFAGGLPAGTSQTVVDVPCSDDGLPQIINFAYNPSVETNATDWSASGTGETGTRTASPTARVGDFVFRGTAPNSPGNRLDELSVLYDVASVTSGPIPLPGDELTVSLYFRATAGAWIGTYTWQVQYTMDGFSAVQFNGEEEITDSGDWHRLEQTFTLPENVDLESIEVTVFTPLSITQGGGMDIDGLMIQRGNDATTAFDETNTEAAWSGDPNTSALLLNQTQADISEDPDCPPLPAPPAPPQIDDDCITVPTTYNRTVVSISADTVPRNLTAFPIITLTAGEAPVRQARIRFWENPDNLTIDELDPCSYVGEMIVSYLADGATMVINGVTREVTISKPGFADQNGNHVLYGADGGPVEWPELSGGIPYLVTLELDSGETYTDALMLVDLVVRD